MNKYECTVIFDASASVTVEADNPEDAAIKAEDELQGRQHLCHHCANNLETGDALGVHVYNEECTEQLLDTTFREPQRKPLTDEQIKAALSDMSALQMPFNKLIPAIARAIEAAHGIKEEA